MENRSWIIFVFFLHPQLFSQIVPIRLHYDPAKTLKVNVEIEHAIANRFFDGPIVDLKSNRVTSILTYGITNFLSAGVAVNFMENNYYPGFQPQDVIFTLKSKYTFRFSDRQGTTNAINLHFFPRIDFRAPMSQYDPTNPYAIGMRSKGLRIGNLFYLSLAHKKGMVSAYVGYTFFNTSIPNALALNFNTGWVVKSFLGEVFYNYKAAFGPEPGLGDLFLSAYQFPIRSSLIGTRVHYQKFSNWDFNVTCSYVVQGHLVWNNLSFAAGVTRLFNFDK